MQSENPGSTAEPRRFSAFKWIAVIVTTILMTVTVIIGGGAWWLASNGLLTLGPNSGADAQVQYSGSENGAPVGPAESSDLADLRAESAVGPRGADDREVDDSESPDASAPASSNEIHDPMAEARAEILAARERDEGPYITPVWLERPDSIEFSNFYPTAAMDANIEGRVVLDCVIRRNGRLRCEIQSETPLGWGFGAATLEAARSYRAADGDLYYGFRVLLPVTWRLEG